MKFTWNWLHDHLDSSTDMAAMLDALTMLGLEVEGVDNKADGLKSFTIARVIDAAPHPNADNLKVCRLDTGKQEVEVVCGAPNARAGLLGVFAPVGSYVPGIDLTLTAAEIRGVKSQGMLCSERELMLSDEHEGIIELAADAPIGEDFVAWAGLDDPVIEIAITPNRADCLGVRGIARDLAAAGYGALKPLKEVSVKASSESSGKSSGKDSGKSSGSDLMGKDPMGKSPISWKIDLPKDKHHLVPRVAGRGFTDLSNPDSPRWMQQRLTAIGQRPISALVDITNYIMVDLGRPLHAYDMDKISGNNLVIRLAKEGETVLALNEKTYTLSPDMLVIGDDKGADDLAGIMGGQRTGISETSCNMFLEMAVFDPVNIATTGRKLNIHSDARYRFERGLDVTSPDWAMDYVSALVLDICGGEASEITLAGEGADWQRQIDFNPPRVKALSGVEVSLDKQAQILTDLGFELDRSDTNLWKVSPPPWRGDIDGAADLVEEIIRINGFDAIAETDLPAIPVISHPVATPSQKRPIILRRLLAARGLMEAVTFSFIDADAAKRFGGVGEDLRILNPISSELEFMRPSILPTLLAAIGRNAARGEEDAAMFEVGPVFLGSDAQDQRQSCAALRHGAYTPRDWTGMARKVDWLDAKADGLAVLAALGIKPESLQSVADAPSWYHPGQSGAFCQGKTVLGYFGSLHPAMLDAYDLSGACVGFEILLDNVPLPKDKGSARPLAALSSLQAVERDFAFIVDEEIPAETLLRAIRGAERELICGASVFDVYIGKGIEAGRKSVAVAVTLQPTKATLRDEDIEAVSAAIIEAVKKHCGGTLRG